MEEKQSTTSWAHKGLWALAMLLCVAALATGIYLTHAAFTSNDYLKSVAATGATQNLFESDLLMGYTSVTDNVDARSVVVNTSGDSDTCSFSFKIYNYLPGDKNRVNDKDVNATLTIEASGATKSWSVDPAIDESGTSLSFPAYTATDPTYTVTFSKEDLGNISFLIKAQVGDDSPGTNLKMLAARVTPSERATVTAASVTGDWVDKNSGAGVGEFAAYNYRVTVSGAAANVTLTWDNAKVELDPHFRANHTGATFETNDTTSSVIYEAQPGSEVVNFLNADGAPFDSWDSIGVSCTGETITGTAAGDTN